MMTKNKSENRAESRDEEWAIIPFDETEDETRWENLMTDIDKLSEDTARIEAVHEKLPAEQHLPDFHHLPQEIEDDLF